MIKRLTYILKNQKGFTLIEMLTVLAIFTILSVSVAMLIEPALNIFYNSTNLSRSAGILSNVLDMMEDQMTYAQGEIKIISEWPAGDPDIQGIQSAEYETPKYGGTVVFGQDNQMPVIKSRKTDPVTNKEYVFSYGKEFYMNNTVKVGLQIDGDKPDVMCINAVAYDKNNKLIGSQKRYIRLLNKPAIMNNP